MSYVSVQKASRIGEPLVGGANTCVFAMNTKPFVVSTIKSVWIQTLEQTRQNFCCHFSTSRSMNLVFPSSQESKESDLIRRLFKNPTVKVVFPSGKTPEISITEPPEKMQITDLFEKCLTFSFPEEPDLRAFRLAETFLFPTGYCMIPHIGSDSGNSLFQIYAIPEISFLNNQDKDPEDYLLTRQRDLEKRFVSFEFLEKIYLPSLDQNENGQVEQEEESSSSDKSDSRLKEARCALKRLESLETNAKPQEEEKLPTQWPDNSSQRQISPDGRDLPTMPSDRQMPKQTPLNSSKPSKRPSLLAFVLPVRMPSSSSIADAAPPPSPVESKRDGASRKGLGKSPQPSQEPITPITKRRQSGIPVVSRSSSDSAVGKKPQRSQKDQQQRLQKFANGSSRIPVPLQKSRSDGRIGEPSLEGPIPLENPPNEDS